MRAASPHGYTVIAASETSGRDRYEPGSEKLETILGEKDDIGFSAKVILDVARRSIAQGR